LLGQLTVESGLAEEKTPPAVNTSRAVSEACDSTEAQARLLLEAGISLGDAVRDKKHLWPGIAERAWMQNEHVWVHVKAVDPESGQFSFSAVAGNLEKA